MVDLQRQLLETLTESDLVRIFSSVFLLKKSFTLIFFLDNTIVKTEYTRLLKLYTDFMIWSMDVLDKRVWETVSGALLTFNKSHGQTKYFYKPSILLIEAYG